jgi:hypothetical protein
MVEEQGAEASPPVASAREQARHYGELVRSSAGHGAR